MSNTKKISTISRPWIPSAAQDIPQPLPSPIPPLSHDKFIIPFCGTAVKSSAVSCKTISSCSQSCSSNTNFDSSTDRCHAFPVHSSFQDVFDASQNYLDSPLFSHAEGSVGEIGPKMLSPHVGHPPHSCDLTDKPVENADSEVQNISSKESKKMAHNSNWRITPNMLSIFPPSIETSKEKDEETVQSPNDVQKVNIPCSASSSTTQRPTSLSQESILSSSFPFTETASSTSSEVVLSSSLPAKCTLLSNVFDLHSRKSSTIPEAEAQPGPSNALSIPFNQSMSFESSASENQSSGKALVATKSLDESALVGSSKSKGKFVENASQIALGATLATAQSTSKELSITSSSIPDVLEAKQSVPGSSAASKTKSDSSSHCPKSRMSSSSESEDEGWFLLHDVKQVRDSINSDKSQLASNIKKNNWIL